MSSRRSAGFTLIEMIVAIVIIGVGLAGVLAAFDTVVRSSSDPLIRKQMLAVAEEMMDEILLKPYGVGTGTIVGCNRSAADDIFDYNGYAQPVCDIDGTPRPDLAGYAVAVAFAAPPALGGIAAGSVAQITVTVTFGAQSVTLTGWRTNYAAGLS